MRTGEPRSRGFVPPRDSVFILECDSGSDPVSCAPFFIVRIIQPRSNTQRDLRQDFLYLLVTSTSLPSVQLSSNRSPCRHSLN